MASLAVLPGEECVEIDHKVCVDIFFFLVEVLYVIFEVGEMV